ncbi:MAG: hypothetical protein LQ340_006889, partial [Diploschistes diacapsis]
ADRTATTVQTKIAADMLGFRLLAAVAVAALSSLTAAAPIQGPGEPAAVNITTVGQTPAPGAAAAAGAGASGAPLVSVPMIPGR